MHKQALVAFLIGCAPFVMAEITELVVDLPAEVEWTMVMDEATANTYHRAWIPAGTTVEDTDLWLIESQKFDQEKRRSARRFLIDLRNRARAFCADLIHSGPEKIILEKHRSDWGGFFCARWHGEDYGTFTEQRVFAHGNTVFVVTSELRFPPTSVAGLFPVDNPGDAAVFMKRIEASSRVVREAVRVISAP